VLFINFAAYRFFVIPMLSLVIPAQAEIYWGVLLA
jgi:hypothetical protein